jgi:hypothetical protein
MRRRKPSCVRRENPIIPACCSHQRLAIAAWTCSGAASASHTLISGKLNEFIRLFVGDTDTPPRRADQWRIETEPPARPSRFGFFHGTLDPRKNELSRRAALSSSGLVDPAVKLAGQVNRGTDRIGFHTHRLCADDLNKSIARGNAGRKPGCKSYCASMAGPSNCFNAWTYSMRAWRPVSVMR